LIHKKEIILENMILKLKLKAIEIKINDAKMIINKNMRKIIIQELKEILMNRESRQEKE
jgi:hypothetical protein